MIACAFTKHAETEFLKLPRDVQRRILGKVEHWLQTTTPLRFAERIVDFPQPCFRYRIGDYRVLYDVYDEDEVVLILVVGHRRDVYK